MTMPQSDNDRGFELFDGNEKTAGSKINDPAKYRVTTPIMATGGGGGCLSFNASRQAGEVQDGHQQDEMAMLRCEQDERVRGDVGNRQAELNVQLFHEADMVKPIRFLWDGIILDENYRRSFRAQLGLEGPMPPTTPQPPTTPGNYDGAEFQGSEGKFRYVRQQDGHDVLYNAAGQAIWASDGPDPNGTWLNP